MHFRWDSDLLFGKYFGVCTRNSMPALLASYTDWLCMAVSSGALAERGAEFIYRLARVTPKTDETPLQPSSAYSCQQSFRRLLQRVVTFEASSLHC